MNERNAVLDDAAADAVRDLAQHSQWLADAHVALRDTRYERRNARGAHAWRILYACGIAQGDTVRIQDGANLVVGELVTARARRQPSWLAVAGRQQIGVKVGIQRPGPQSLIEHYVLWLPRVTGDLGWEISLVAARRE
jgi:hypothetical protein